MMGVFGLVTMPLGNAYSRWRERKGDTYALQATGDGDAFASAMTRLANQNLADTVPIAIPHTMSLCTWCPNSCASIVSISSGVNSSRRVSPRIIHYYACSRDWDFEGIG